MAWSDLLRGTGRGALAGIGGTAAMTVAMVAAHVREPLGRPPPHQVTMRVLSRMGARPRSWRDRSLTSLLAHLATGASLGALFGLSRAAVARRAPVSRAARTAAGAIYGPVIWAVMYGFVLPRTGLFPRPARDRRRQRALALVHVLYGAVTGSLT
jgi:hypothetical protein